MIRENFVFFKEFLLEFQTTGAIFPTSRWAAKALTDPLRVTNRGTKRILELGPGTGAVTVKILDDMILGDTLTVCEINPRFMKALKEKLEKLPSFQLHKKNVTFFEGPVQEMPENEQYEVIVCALPFLNFPLEMVQEIFGKLRRLSTEATLMTYYEYIGLRRVSKAVAPTARKQRMREIDGYMKSLADRIRLGRTRVWLNILPINIYTVKPSAA